MFVWFAPAQDYSKLLPTCIWLSVRLLASSQNLNVDALYSASKFRTSSSCCRNEFMYMDHLSPPICSFKTYTGRVCGMWKPASFCSKHQLQISCLSVRLSGLLSKIAINTLMQIKNFSLTICYQNAIVPDHVSSLSLPSKPTPAIWMGVVFFCSNSETISLCVSAHCLVCITNILRYSVKITEIQGFVSALIWTIGIHTWQR